jgi:hypothetical protein
MKEEVKGVLSRLALVIHWVGFIFGVIFFFGAMIGGFVESGSDDIAMFLSAPLLLFFFTGIGWLIRYIIVGKVHYLPYK